MSDLRGTRASAWLDALRALAALVVFSGHLRQNLFVGWSASPRESLVNKLFFFTTGFGHEAVMVFFVLSGYLVGGAVVRARMAGRWSWPAFLVARGSRLWIVLLPALVLGAVLDGLGRELVGPPLRGLESIDARFTVAAWFGSLVFLQEILVPPFGSNAPLWSLSYELWYYLACPFLVAVAIKGDWRWRMLQGLAVAAILAFTGPQIAAYFSIWLLGLCVFLVPPLPRAAGRVVALAGLAGLLPLLVWLGTVDGYRGTFMADLLVGLLVAVLLVGLQGDERPAAGIGARLARWLAGWSYSLYLVHLPVLVLVNGLLFSWSPQRWVPSPPTAALAVAIGLLVLGYAYLVSRLTEARTQMLRRWMLRRFAPGGP